ncbi:tyrosine-protein kinase Etk/Wzc [Modicisalibacter ilicicola DSM 19980]|uniref:Tyrosine-protein kinase Etk/Wzc n=1 Tax=Modicisalibacter ilicicola DSM 19980 TaxID=1121942 RepID=A0A1M5C024_9GAMM|nr:polysaccharide biosynthesis tyrosine autokinase [Halomonas ilicicola]SHF48144.1 tyrosine-protein kinase Etk/Wzc [Halomonas ilicicola DSM 19980]
MSQEQQVPAATRYSGQSDETVDLGRLFGLLLDHKWKILLVTLLFMLGGLIYALLVTPVYQGDALVQVEKTATSGNNSDLAVLLGEEAPATAAQIEILGSRLILGQAAYQVNLDTVVRPVTPPLLGDALIRYDISRPGFAAGRPEIWGGESIRVESLSVAPELVGQPFTLEVIPEGRYQILDRQGGVIGTGQVGKPLEIDNPWIELRVGDIQAPPGAQFTLLKRSRQDTIGYLKSRFEVIQKGTDTGVLELMLTGTERDEIQSSLDAITQVYLAQNIARQAAEAEKSLAFLEKQMPNVRQQLLDAENRLNEYRAEQDSVDLTLETQNMLTGMVDIEGRLNELQMQESELSRRFTPNHPVYAALLEKKAQLKREQANLEERTANLPETQQQILRMTRDVEVTQQIYVQLLNRMQELNIAKAGTVGNVRIIDSAFVAPGPIEPKTSVIVLLATIIGAMLAVGFVLIRGLLNRGVESPEQLEELGLPVYATVPLSEDQEKLIKRVKHRSDQASKQVIGGMLAKVNPTDTAIEALRGLRTSLHFAMLDAHNNCIMVTGPSPGIGKSFVSINLAAVCAQAGQKVLVIDADMRKGNIHMAFNDRSEAGLSEVLSGKLDLQHAVRNAGLPGLYYMSRGIAPPNPSELLMQRSFTQLIEQVGAEYDLVIIDTPPILAVTDAAVIGKLVGTSLMMARFELNPPREVKVALRRLETAGVRVKGCILNAMERKAATSYGYGYYNYSYK